MATRLIEEIVLKVSIDSKESDKQMKSINDMFDDFLDTSKKVVNISDKLSNSFDDISKSLKSIKSTNIDKIFKSNNISSTTSAIKDSSKELNKWGKTLKDNSSTSKTYSTSLINMKTAFALLSVAGIAKATSALVSFGKEQLRQDVLIDRYAKRLNLATGEFQAYADAAKLFGVDVEDAGQGLKNLTERIADAQLMQSGAAFEALEILGLDVDSLNELDAIEKMITVVEALNKIDPSERQFLQLELGEEEMFKLQEMAMRGKVGIRELMEEMKQLNPVLSEVDSAALREVDFQAGRAQLAFKGIFKTLNTEMAPALISLGKLAEEFAVIFRDDVLPTILEFGGVFGEKLVSLAQKAFPLIAAIGISSWEVLKLSMMTFADFAVGVFDVMSLAFGETAEDIANPAPWKTIAGFMIGFSKNIKNFIVKPFKQAASFIAEQVGNFQLEWEDLMLGMMGGWKILWGELQLMAFEGIQAILDKLKDVPLLSDKLNINQDLEAVKIAIKDINREITSGQEMINLATDPNQTNPMLELAKELNKEVAEIQGSIVEGFAEGFRIMEDRNGPMAKMEKALEKLRNSLKEGPSTDFIKRPEGDEKVDLKPLSAPQASSRLDVGSVRTFEFLHKTEDVKVKIMQAQLREQKKTNAALNKGVGSLTLKGAF